MSVRTRLAANFGANIFARAVGAGLQIVSVPLLIHAWGAGVYAEWLLLSTIPAYLTMSDIGFATVAGNEMTMLLARGEVARASSVFQAANVFITAISIMLAALSALLLWLLPFPTWFHIRSLASSECREICVLLGISTLITLQGNLFQQGFRAIGKAAAGVLVKSSTILVLLLGMLVVLWAGGSPAWMARTYLLTNVAGTFVLWRMLRSQAAWARLGVPCGTSREIKELAGSALFFMSFPVGELLSLQGMLILLGHLLGPTAVLVFSTARTVARSGQQVLQLVNASVWPEIAAAFGAGNRRLLRELHRRACQASLFGCLAVVFLTLALGPSIWKSWTLGRVNTNPPLLFLLLIQMLIGSFWYTSAVVPVATNHHHRVAKRFLTTSCFSLILADCLVQLSGMRLQGAALALILCDALMCTHVLKHSLRLTEDSFAAMCRALLTLPAIPRFSHRIRGSLRLD